MTTPRRRLVRTVPAPAPVQPQRQHLVQKLRQRLERERAALARWQTRLKRAFNAVQKCQQRIVRIERQLAHTEV